MDPSSKALVPACRKLKTSHIVIPFYATRSIIMPHGISGRPDAQPNSNKNTLPHLTALAALLDVRRAAVNQIIDLYHWDRWWEVRPELNFLDKKSLLSDVAWYKSMLTLREISLIPTRGLSFETHERDSLTQVISLFKPLGNSDARPKAANSFRLRRLV